jgi:hypothetical protein
MNRRGFIQSILGGLTVASALKVVPQLDLLVPDDTPIELGAELGFEERIIYQAPRNGWLYIATIRNQAPGSEQWDWSELYVDEPNNTKTLTKARAMATMAFKRIGAMA